MSGVSELKELAGFRPCGAPAVSIYLDVDPVQYTPVKLSQKARQLLRDTAHMASIDSLPEPARASFQADVDRIQKYIGTEFDRRDRLGLVMFACTQGGLWHVQPLRLRVSDRIEVQPWPVIAPLAQLMAESPPCLLVLADREKARLLAVHAGEIREELDVKDKVLGRIRPGTHYGLMDARIERHVDEHIRQHLVNVAHEVARLAQRNSPWRVLLAGTPDVLPELYRLLSPDVQKLLAGRVPGLMINASPDNVLEAAAPVIAAAVRAEEQALVTEVRDGWRPGGRAALGMDETLDALQLGAVRVLLVDPELIRCGYVCRECGRLYTPKRACPTCGSERQDPLPDVVEGAVHSALGQDARLVFVPDTPDWTRIGGIGAMLHFPIAGRVGTETATTRE